MKKFLTVLLALSVVFTYSFGTVFAADPTTSAATTLQESYEAAQADLLATKNAVVAGLADEYAQSVGTVPVSVKIAKSVYAEVAEVIYSDYMSVLAAQKAAATTTGAVDFTTAPALSGASTYGTLDGMAYGDINTADEFRAKLLASGITATAANIDDNPYLEKTLRLVFDTFKASVKAELDKIDLGLYSDDIMDADAAYPQTYKQLATDAKADLVKAVDDEVISSDMTGAGIVAAYTTVNAQKGSDKIVTSTSYAAVGETVILTYKFKENTVSDGAIYLVTKEDLKDVAATDAAKVAGFKATVASNAANYVVTDAAYRDAAKKKADAYVEVINSRIDNLKSADMAGYSVPTVASDDWEAYTTSYAALKAKVDTFKVMVDATGKLKYDATKLDKNLDEAKIALYKIGTFASDAALTLKAENQADDVQWAKDVRIAELKDLLDAKLYGDFGAENYYDLEKAKITAEYDKQIAKINAATTVAQVESITTSVAVTAKVKADVESAIKGLTKFQDEYTSLTKYVAYLNGDTKSWQDGYKTLDETELAKFYAEKGARTGDEVVALNAEAKAYCDALKTNKQKADDKAAVEALVKALPSQITLAEKEAVLAAWTANDDFGGSIDNQAKLDNAVAQLKAAQLKAFKDAYEALPALDKLTVANKDAVKALNADVKAYKETAMFADKNAGNLVGFNANDLKALVAKVQELDKKAVIDAIAAMPADATKAQVEAVRAQYDAYVAEYKDALSQYKADDITNIDKLLYAEAQIKAQAADLSKLTLKASTKKVGKKIKVTLKGAAIDDSTAYIQLWKSKNAVKWTFSKRVAITATSAYITKPYKGKTYVKFRVVTVNEDGTKNFSAWSNLGCRIVK